LFSLIRALPPTLQWYTGIPYAFFAAATDAGSAADTGVVGYVVVGTHEVPD
jgi:hypothetical protein